LFPALVPVLALALAALASPASAANLTDVRIGVHGDHTRIVLETDAKAPYIVDAGEKEIVVHVDAAATAEAVTAKSPHLIWAKVEPTQIGADVHLALKQPADVKALVLTGPDRIVLDLYPRKTGAAPLPPPELLPEEQPEQSAAAEPMAAPQKAEPTPREEPAAVSHDQLAGDAEAEAAVAQAEAETAMAEAQPAEPEASAAEPESEAAPAVAAEPEEMTEAVAAAEPEAPAVPSEATPPATSNAPTTPATSTTPGRLFSSPAVLGAVAVALIALSLYLRRRLKTAEKPPRPAAKRDEPPAPFEPAKRVVAADGAARPGESVFDVESESIGPLPKDEDGLESVQGARVETGDENERRIGQLERRLEELVEARERLERQVAAQTEELRVQRAAIARTQRVLRTVAPSGGDDSGSSEARS